MAADSTMIDRGIWIQRIVVVTVWIVVIFISNAIARTLRRWAEPEGLETT